MSTTAWLTVFVVVVLVDVAVLLFDAWLDEAGRRTITATVRLHPILGVPLIAWQLLGGLALAKHLYDRVTQ